MRSVSEHKAAAARALARVDVRLALVIAGVTAAFTSLLLCGLLAHAVTEALEEQVAAADRVVEMVGRAYRQNVDAGALLSGVAYRVVDDAGGHGIAGGAWPSDAAIWRTASLRAAFRARDGQYLVRDRQESGGVRVSTAIPLRHFVREREELTTRAAIVVLVGLLGSIGLGMMSARRALQPLRDTTAAIHAIDPRRLGARVPVRGTSDDVDALAVATNEVLARLEWAFGRLSGFSADVAHELRTPVNRVLNTAEVALTTTDDAAAKDDALAGIQTTAESMRRTIEQLLLLAKGEDGRLRVVRDTVDLGALVNDLVELYAPAAERLEKQLVVAPSVMALSVDRELVERAVVNLLENAIAHTDRGATIRVGVEARDGGAVVVVEDSGPGIPARDREQVFERFVRLDGARAPGGVGLGLPIARMVARLHDGDLQVGTSALGGAAFRLLLSAA